VIADLAHLVARVIHPKARLASDTGKPDGTPRKLLDVARLHALGWCHRYALEEGIRHSRRWFLDQHAEARGALAG
jgi:GDP-L-fucose synthase